MQVFMPYADLKLSVVFLDPKRLGNQIYREALTLVRGGWSNHPASKMWRGYEFQLCQYCLFGLEELERRGRKYPHHVLTFQNIQRQHADTGLPPWFGNYEVHSSHRAALLYKRFDWYSKLGWPEEPAVPDKRGRLPYVWPEC